jgi:hypothetical protein
MGATTLLWTAVGGVEPDAAPVLHGADSPGVIFVSFETFLRAEDHVLLSSLY